MRSKAFHFIRKRSFRSQLLEYVNPRVKAWSETIWGKIVALSPSIRVLNWRTGLTGRRTSSPRFYWISPLNRTPLLRSNPFCLCFGEVRNVKCRNNSDHIRYLEINSANRCLSIIARTDTIYTKIQFVFWVKGQVETTTFPDVRTVTLSKKDTLQSRFLNGIRLFSATR